MSNFDFTTDPHRRLNILTGEYVLVSPHRSKRPWQGKVEDQANDDRPTYDPKCYLCPGNERADGDTNPDYQNSFVFLNDFSALLNDTPEGDLNENELLVAESSKGICKVISFSPNHKLTLPEMEIVDIAKVVDVWQNEFNSLSETSWIKYIQIFENKGDIMGCSNPHPHGQIWSSNHIPQEVQKEDVRFKAYYEKHGRTILTDYVKVELEKKERIVYENEHFVVLVPFWAVWPYETMVVSKAALSSIKYFNTEQKLALADALSHLTIKYDNLFEVSFPYSAGMHQEPVNDGERPYWHWHMHFYPPLLRSATVKKFMVGYEMLANAQRDITPEFAAQRLLDLPAEHYKKQNS